MENPDALPKREGGLENYKIFLSVESEANDDVLGFAVAKPYCFPQFILSLQVC